MTLGRALLPSITLCLLATATTSAAAEPTKDECVDANTKAQSLRRDNKLQDSRAQLLVCAADACPAVVRDDCVQRLDELGRVMPTLVLVAKDGKGSDLSAVTVKLDGAPWLARLDGAAVPIDPGEHELTLDAAGQPSVTQRLIIREGEKARREIISIGAAPVKSDAVAPTAPARLTIAAGPEDSVAVDGAAVGVGRWEGPLPPGTHEVTVSHAGMKTYRASVDLQPAGVRSLGVTLEAESSGVPLWAWIAGGVVVVGGASVGGYFLFRGKEEPGVRPTGGLGSVSLSLGRLGTF
jgi:hypothetical protein